MKNTVDARNCRPLSLISCPNDEVPTRFRYFVFLQFAPLSFYFRYLIFFSCVPFRTLNFSPQFDGLAFYRCVCVCLGISQRWSCRKNHCPEHYTDFLVPSLKLSAECADYSKPQEVEPPGRALSPFKARASPPDTGMTEISSTMPKRTPPRSP